MRRQKGNGSGAPVKIQTTKDQKIELLQLQNAALLLQQQANALATKANLKNQDFVNAINKIATELKLDNKQYIFDTDSLDFKLQSSLPQGAQVQSTVVPKVKPNGAVDKQETTPQ